MVSEESWVSCVNTHPRALADISGRRWDVLLQQSAARWRSRRRRLKGPFRACRWVVVAALLARVVGIQRAGLPVSGRLVTARRITAAGLPASSPCNLGARLPASAMGPGAPAARMFYLMDANP